MSSLGSGCTNIPSASWSAARTVYRNRMILSPLPVAWKGTALRSAARSRVLFGAMSSHTKTLPAAPPSITSTGLSNSTSISIVSFAPYVSGVPSPFASSAGVDVIATDVIAGSRPVRLSTSRSEKAATSPAVVFSGFVAGLA